MSPKRDEGIDAARRLAVRDALVDAGMEPVADRWCDAWEVEATRQRIIRSTAYPHIGRRWIDAQRGAGRPPP